MSRLSEKQRSEIEGVLGRTLSATETARTSTLASLPDQQLRTARQLAAISAVLAVIYVRSVTDCSLPDASVFIEGLLTGADDRRHHVAPSGDNAYVLDERSPDDPPLTDAEVANLVKVKVRT